MTGFCESGNEHYVSEIDADFLDKQLPISREGICSMVELDRWLNILYFLYASVLCTYSITSVGRTAISQVPPHCYHTPCRTPGKSPSGAVTNQRITYMLQATSVQTLEHQTTSMMLHGAQLRNTAATLHTKEHT